ncbi:MAG TPA: ATP-dependent DNA helicase RecG [Pseudomonadales bacterium]
MIAEQRVESLKGVGPSLKAKLERLGIFRVGDLLLHLPIRYQDRSRVVPLRDVHPQQECLVQGQVVDSSLGYGRRRSWLVTIEDGTGYLGLRFFHFSKRQQSGLQPGTYVRCFGEIRFGPRGGGPGLEMAHPEYRAFTSEPPDPDPELTPVYPTTKGLGQNRLRGLIDQALSLEWPSDSGAPYQTLAYLHRPPADAPAADIERAQERVALDELTAYYLVMKQRQRDRAKSRALPLPQSQQLGRELLRRLGFRLTHAQRRVITEVLEDLSSETPMLRLLQGDVGSGKTVVAAFAAIRAAEHGRQTALMAPTEILAEQHYVNFSAWLEPLGIPVVLLTGSQSAKERAARQQALEEGEALVAVGTHALFQDKVNFNALALTIVDEQHRFGVHQRMALRSKGAAPHQLVMTATPIPRTLTMALYADMDVSVLDELPPGRTPIDTRVISDARKEEVIRSAADAMARGEQVYWVCPLIEDSEQLDAAAAEPTAELLAERLEPPIGLLHGRMTGEQKAKAMMDFKEGRTRLLVATTVIEVGVDVPNATLMVIENPERMGLAQLHQLRGRVGRGEKASRCLLVYKTPLSAAARQRLSVMRESQDGFHIAEKDLELRGPGELLGARQTGEQQFRVADLARHSHLIAEVLARGERLLQTDPTTARELLNAWAPEDNGHIAV